MSAEFLDMKTYFPNLDSFKHRMIFDDIVHPWDVLTSINPYILAWIADHMDTLEPQDIPGTRIFYRTERLEETILQVNELVQIEKLTAVKGVDIILEPGVVLEPGAMIKAPAIIGKNTEIRQGAYIRGSVITGEHCTIGHTTEVKNSIFMNHTEAGHFAYVGDSVLGSYVNLGAGTKLANLQLRRAKDKEDDTFPHIFLSVAGTKYATGTAKIGAFMGDYSEAGCNSVTAPATFLGAHSWAFANTTVMKGYYPPRTIIRE